MHHDDVGRVGCPARDPGDAPWRRRGSHAAGIARAGRPRLHAGAAMSAEPRTLAPFGRRLLRVAKNERLGAYNMIWVADSDGPSDPEPGQFYMLATEREWGGADGRPYLPRAFSFARATDSALAFLLEAIGPGTSRLARLERDDGVWVTGPLGIGFTSPERGRPVLVGGGIGAAPLMCWREALG